MRIRSALLSLAAAIVLTAYAAAFAADTDGDGIVDSLDNCPELYNPGQEDGDGDGVGDTCDNCPDHWNPRLDRPSPYNIQPDADGDGIGNVCDLCTDQDGDGYGDPGFPTNTCLEDNCPGFANPDQLDSDGDGVGDTCGWVECGDVNGSGDFSLGDLSLTMNYLWAGGKSPVSMYAANTGACGGMNIHDLTYAWGDMFFWFLNCDGPTSCTPVPDGTVTLDRVDGMLAPGVLATERPIRFYIRLVGGDSTTYRGLTNGFRVYSPTGLTWGRTSITELVDFSEGWPYMFYFVTSTYTYGVTGSGADTVALGYFDGEAGTGLLPGYDSVTHAIDIGPIPNEYSGGEICLDSCWYPPGGDWMWAYHGLDAVPCTPSWDGPHCFTIYNCCQNRGDIDNNGGTNPDISDLIYLVTYMFQEGPAPLCMTAADIDGNEALQPDITDLIYLVQFMFQEGPAPAPCPA